MRTASPSLVSVRALVRVILVAVLVGLGLVAAGLLLPKETTAADPIYACAANSNGQLRYVTSPTCKSNETLVNLNNPTAPVTLCAVTGTGQLRWVITANQCKANESALVSPGVNPITTCVRHDNGAMRLALTPCHPTAEFAVIIPTQNQPPVAQDQAAAVNEDGSVAIQLQATDPDGNALTFAITTQPVNGTLSGFNAATGAVTYTPNANYFGPDSFTFTASDASSVSNVATVAITVNPVNDTPAFTSGGSVTVNEDSGAYSAAWATGVTAGPNEDGQMLTFVVTTDNTALFASQPAVTATGVLTFTPAADANGAATVTVVLQDNGGTANGGADTSAAQTFTITVQAVNDRPSFAIDDDQTVAEDAGAQVVPNFAHDFDAGPPDEDASQAVDHYMVATADEDQDLFSDLPSISNTGTLTYTTAPNATGTAHIRVRVQDDGGTANGGQDTSDALEFTITITAVNDAPLAAARNFGADSVETNMQRSIDDDDGLLNGATDPDSGDAGFTLDLDVGTVNGESPSGGTITATIANVGTVVADAETGAFTFDPAPGVTGNVSFPFTVCDNGNPLPSRCSSAVDATLHISGPVTWFVNPAAATNGTGTLASPFNALSAADAVDADDHRIFVYAGTSSTGIALNAGEWLVGQGVTGFDDYDDLMGIAVPSGTIDRPTIGSGTVTLQDTLTLNANAVVKAVALATTTNTGLTDPSGTTPGVDVVQTSVTTTTGTALSFNDLGGTLTFASVSAGTSGLPTTGISVTNASADIAINAGTIQNTTTAAISLVDGNGDFGYAGSITNSTGRTVLVQDKDSGSSVSFAGAITATGGTGILLQNNVTTIAFSGALTLSTGTNAAFTATSSGTISATNTASELTTTTSTALLVTNTSIGASGLTFRSVGANGATNGIVLTNTGSSGGLTVTGTGSANSGGTIANTTGSAIILTNTTSPSFNNMLLQDAGDHGVTGTQVTNFSFTSGAITGAGNASDESAISFDDSLTGSNVSGIVTITGNTISLPDAHGIDILNGAGTLSDVTISFNALTGDGPGPVAGSAINVIAIGSASAVGSITRATITNNTINEFNEIGIQVRGGNAQDTAGAPAGTVGVPGSATDVITITGNLMNGGAGGIGFNADRFFTGGVAGRGQGNFNISDNGTAASPITNIDGVVIELQADGPAVVTSTVSNNQIVANNAVGSAGIAVACDADSLTSTTDNGSMTTTITGNNVSQTDGPGIFTLARGVSSCTFNATITDNTVAAPSTTNAARAGIRVDSGSSGSTTTVCLDLRGNITAGSTNASGTTSPGINLRRQNAAGVVFAIEGMAATDSPGVENYVNGLNTSTSGTFGVGGTALLAATTGFSNCSSAP